MMPENVVYILGAGFSAPLGLPLVNNFFSVAKDLYASDKIRFASFQEVFARVRDLSAAKNLFHVDLTNVEEILSLFEMAQFTGAANTRPQFVKFVSDVVTALTPAKPHGSLVPSEEEAFYGENVRLKPWLGYVHLVANLAGHAYVRGLEGKRTTWIKSSDPPARYGVITLNYDLVLETAAEIASEHFQPESEIGFSVVTTVSRTPSDRPVLAKIHGSVHDDSIIPPTWNKATRPDIAHAWGAALNLLRTANYIRFIGYSLPETDSYVRYLLKYAGADAEHLKSIDIICLDSSGEVERRYRSFIEVSTRFASLDCQVYLDGLVRKDDSFVDPDRVPRPRLEVIHEAVMLRSRA